MKIYRLEWLILRSYIGPFIMSFAVILFILVMQFMALYMDHIFGKGLGLDVIGKLFFYAGGRLSITALPVALLAGALMSFGNLGENYELAAIKSSGISIFKVMRPLIFLGFLMMSLSFWFTFYVIPSSNLKFFSLLYDVQRKKPDVAIKPGYFYNDIDGFVIRVSDKDLSTGTLYDVMIYDHTEKRGNANIIIADSAFTQMSPAGTSMKMVLYSGSRYEEIKPDAGQPDSYRHGRTYYDSLYYRFNLSGFDLDRTDESHFKHQITMPMDKLSSAVDSLEGLKIENKRKYFDQLARYTRVDTTFATPGIYIRRVTIPTEKDAKKDSLAGNKSESATRDTTLKVKIDSTLTSENDTLSSSNKTAKKRKIPPSSGKEPIQEQNKQRSAQNPINTVLQRDTFPVIAAELRYHDMLDCFEEIEAHDLGNRALTNARAVKSYLEFMIKKKKDDDKIRRRYYFEYYHRYAIPITCLLFMLIGASLGAIIRKGGLGFPSLISLLLFIVFYIMITQGKKMAREDVILPWIGAFLPVLVFGPISVLLTYQATTDSRILDESVWSMVNDKIALGFRRIRALFQKKKHTLSTHSSNGSTHLHK